MRRSTFPCPKGTPIGRGQKVPTGSLQFNCTWTYQLRLSQNSSHAALWWISSVLWTHSQRQHQNAGNQPSKDSYGPWSLVKLQLLLHTPDSQWLLMHPCSLDVVPSPPAAGWERPLDPKNPEGTLVISTKRSNWCQQMQPWASADTGEFTPQLPWGWGKSPCL